MKRIYTLVKSSIKNMILVYINDRVATFRQYIESVDPDIHE